MRVSDLDYDLPDDRIARFPPPDRDGARMLRLHRSSGRWTHETVRELPSHIPAGAVVVINDTMVIPARLRGTKQSGGRVEILLLRALDTESKRWEAMGRASKPIRAGARVHIAKGFEIEVVGRAPDGTLEIVCITPDPWQAIERHGEVPLPPYLRRAPTDDDRERYQTVYGRNPGAVAAPTAGLHFTRELMGRLEARGASIAPVTLHVGAGTFAPVGVADLDDHPMHSEWYSIPDETAAAVTEARREARPVFAIGTTAARALESWGATGVSRGDTSLLIQPGYQWRVVDGLLTNFHLPRSTLLALVMAFAGVDPVRSAYRSAVTEGYRFFSYGDAMLAY